MAHRFVMDDKEYVVSLAADGAKVDERTIATNLRWVGPNRLWMNLNGRAFLCSVVRSGDEYHVHLGGKTFTVGNAESANAGSSGVTGSGEVCAPMPGRVVKVLVSEGESVQTGQVLAIVEAMKMEHPLRAPFDGTVKKVAAGADDQVTAGGLIVEVVEAE
jgi:acetyl/propionyl-CoA carboxylase alpha subunit